jgi:hypothetical protein
VAAGRSEPPPAVRDHPSDLVRPRPTQSSQPGAPKKIGGLGVARLFVTMETMHAAGRRNLPPVPRAAVETVLAAVPEKPAVVETPTTGGEMVAVPTLDVTARIDPGQAFVARLRAAAPAFAMAAGADSAVVREVVPPARHRRSRCRVVLRQADGTETDLTFVGEHRRPGAADQDAFETQISGWLSAGRPRDPAWLVDDSEALDGLAVDVTVWDARA